jgi:hypothetical protein
LTFTVLSFCLVRPGALIPAPEERKLLKVRAGLWARFFVRSPVISCLHLFLVLLLSTRWFSLRRALSCPRLLLALARVHPSSSSIASIALVSFLALVADPRACCLLFL